MEKDKVNFYLEKTKYGKWAFQIGTKSEGTDTWALTEEEIRDLSKILKEKGF